MVLARTDVCWRLNADTLLLFFVSIVFSRMAFLMRVYFKDSLVVSVESIALPSGIDVSVVLWIEDVSDDEWNIGVIDEVCTVTSLLG